MRRSLSVLFVLVAASSLFGFGCKKPDPLQVSAPVLNVTPVYRAPYVKKPDTIKPVAPEIVYLRQVLNNLTSASSYHGVVQVPLMGSARGELFVSKKEGIYGILSLASLNSEVFLQNDAVYFRAGTSTWRNLAGTDEGKAIREQMRSVFSLPDVSQPYLIINDGAKFLEKTADTSGCQDYHFTQTFYVPSTFTQDIHVCVKNDLPTRIVTSIPGGVVTATFDRYNDTTVLSKSPLKE